MHRGGVPTPLSLRFFAPMSVHLSTPIATKFFSPFWITFGHPNGTPNGPKMVPNCVPFWSCFSNHDFVVFCSIFGDNDDHRFAQSVCFSLGFPMIFAIAHVGITFVFAMLLVLELAPFCLRAFWRPTRTHLGTI